MSDRAWFRHYNDAHHNRKLRELPEETQLFFWWICELHSRGAYDGATVGALAWSLHLPEDRTQRDLERLRARGLITKDGAIKGWDERQFLSDGTSTERVRKHRKRKKDETDMKRFIETHQSRAEQRQSIEALEGDGDLMNCPESQYVKATQDQIDHLAALSASTGQAVDVMMAARGFGSISKRTASILIDDYRKLRDSQRKATAAETFGERKRRNTNEATAKILGELTDEQARIVDSD